MKWFCVLLSHLWLFYSLRVIITESMLVLYYFNMFVTYFRQVIVWKYLEHLARQLATSNLFPRKKDIFFSFILKCRTIMQNGHNSRNNGFGRIHHTHHGHSNHHGTRNRDLKLNINNGKAVIDNRYWFVNFFNWRNFLILWLCKISYFDIVL